MPTVQKFDRGMIEKVLTAHDLSYTTDDDGDFITYLGSDEDWGCELYCYFIASPGEFYRVQTFTDQRMLRSDWGRVLFACNTWMKDNPGPRVYLHVEDYDNDETGIVTVDQLITLEQGIHAELLDEFTLTVVGIAVRFYTWAHQERSLW